MRKLLLIVGTIIFLMSLQGIWTSSTKLDKNIVMAQNKSVELYFVDSEMLRLIPSTVYIDNKSIEKTAKLVVSELIKGRDGNPKILRTIPNIKNGITVDVKNDTAYVNLSKQFIEQHTDNSVHEILTVYSIVNSLASVEGITKVKFTIDGKVCETFKGHIDMRETFVPDYTV